MIKEVIIVEGKNDIAAVQRAVDADCIATGGYSLIGRNLKSIEAAYKRRGIIILTDPDYAGERIRAYLGIFQLNNGLILPKIVKQWCSNFISYFT